MAKIQPTLKFVNARDLPDNPDAQVAIWVNERMQHYRMVWTKDGKILAQEGEDLLAMKPNHVKSIIRRDYLEAKGPYIGLSKIIDDIMAYKKLRAFALADKRPHLTQTASIQS